MPHKFSEILNTTMKKKLQKKNRKTSPKGPVTDKPHTSDATASDVFEPSLKEEKMLHSGKQDRKQLLPSTYRRADIFH